MATDPFMLRHAHLMALGLSIPASERMQAIRDAMWKQTGDISFLSLFPLVPLSWSTGFIALPDRFTVQVFSEPVVFDSPLTVGDSLFLTSGNRGFARNWAIILAALSLPHTPDREFFPFPTAPGIYLGKSIVEPGALGSVTISDWRLMSLSVEHSFDGDRLTHVRYRVLADRHLAHGQPGDQGAGA